MIHSCYILSFSSCEKCLHCNLLSQIFMWLTESRITDALLTPSCKLFATGQSFSSNLMDNTLDSWWEQSEITWFTGSECGFRSPCFSSCCQQVLQRIVRIGFSCPAGGHWVSVSWMDLLWQGLFGTEFSGQTINHLIAVLKLLTIPFIAPLVSETYCVT